MQSNRNNKNMIWMIVLVVLIALFSSVLISSLNNEKDTINNIKGKKMNIKRTLWQFNIFSNNKTCPNCGDELSEHYNNIYMCKEKSCIFNKQGEL